MEARALAEALARRNETETAERIVAAIEGGSTSSEILFELRWVFDRFLEQGASEDELHAWTKDMRAAIHALLERR